MEEEEEVDGDTRGEEVPSNRVTLRIGEEVELVEIERDMEGEEVTLPVGETLALGFSPLCEGCPLKVLRVVSDARTVFD